MDATKIKPGTVMLEVPKTGAAKHDCFVCTGPRGLPGREQEMAHDAFIVGMCVGINMLQGGYRPKLCIDHETRFREVLAVMVVSKGTQREVVGLCEKLGIEFKVAGEP